MTVMTGTSGTEPRAYDPIDLSSRAFWSTTAAERERSFAVLRAERPVSWHPPVEDALMPDPDDPGYWAVTRRADIVTVSRNNEMFLSGKGVMFENVPEELLEASQSFLAMDPPRHTKLRKVVSAAFTPRQVRRIEDSIKANAKTSSKSSGAAGSGADFVDHCAKELPIRTLSDMVGIPESERQHVAHAADAMVSWADPGLPRRPQPDGGAGREPDVPASGGRRAGRRAPRASRRRPDQQPGATPRWTATGSPMPRWPRSSCCSPWPATTPPARPSATRMKALTDFPDQRAWLMEDFDDRIGSAVEEFVRWATPVMTFRRTAATDFELGGQTILAGEKVVMFYSSGNWDTEAFDHPERFDLSRNPNPHVGFGGGGVHFCLGAHVARAQLRAIFGELLAQLPDIQAGDPAYVPGNFIHGIRSMPCTF